MNTPTQVTPEIRPNSAQPSAHESLNWLYGDEIPSNVIPFRIQCDLPPSFFKDTQKIIALFESLIPKIKDESLRKLYLFSEGALHVALNEISEGCSCREIVAAIENREKCDE